MLFAGILITVVSVLIILFPEFFMKLKSPGISEKASKIPKVKNIFRIWGIVCVTIGILVIVFAII